MMPERSLVVLPVSVPEKVVADGYSPTAVSQVVAAHMARMVAAGRLAHTEELTVGRAPGGLPSFSGISDLPDVQVPGQQFSFHGVRRFVRDFFGIGDPTISISIGHSGANYIVWATAVGGPYDGRRASAIVPSTVRFEKVIVTAAALAVDVAQPLRYATFLTSREKGSRDGHCPAGITCTADKALALVANLLADEYQDDNARAHLVYALLSYEAMRIDAALQHCEAAAEFKETRSWGLIYCAHSHLANDSPTHATATALDASRVWSDDPDVHAGLGNLFLALGDDARAQDAYGRALRLNVKHVYSLIGLGTIDRRAGRYAGAVDHYQAALVINPNEPYAHGGLGASLVGQGYTVRGLRHLELALNVDPTYSVAIDAKREALGCIQPQP